MDNHKQEVLDIIENTLQKIYLETVSTSVLLLKCQRISTLLDSKQECEWVWFELKGYKSAEDIPNYRWITTESIVEHAKVVGGLKQEQLIFSSQLRGKPLDHQFPVLAPCNYLEQSNEELKLKDTIKINPTKEEPIKLLLGRVTIVKPVEVGVVARVSIDTMRNIVAAIRVRIHEFIISQKSALLLQPHIQGIFDETMNLIANKLSILDPELLEELRNIIQKLQSNSELDWRSIADACRTIIQRLTDLIYIDEMTPKGERKPAHDKTRNKCRQIASWALSRINIKIDDSPEGARIERLPIYLDNYYEMIIRSVEKVKHKDTRKLRKDEVDRVAIYTILWMADIIQMLNRANYPWRQVE